MLNENGFIYEFPIAQNVLEQVQITCWSPQN